MKIAIFALLWAIVSFAPQFAGPWYDLNFNLYQGLVSLSLIVLAALLMDKGRHRRAMFSVLIITILLNLADAFSLVLVDQYNSALLVLNTIEVMLILDYTLWRVFCGKQNRNTPDTSGRGNFSPERLRGR